MKWLIATPPTFEAWLDANRLSKGEPHQFAVLAGSTFTAVNIGGSTMASMRTMAIVPPLTVTEDSWVAISWKDGAETATAVVIGPAG